MTFPRTSNKTDAPLRSAPNQEDTTATAAADSADYTIVDHHLSYSNTAVGNEEEHGSAVRLQRDDTALPAAVPEPRVSDNKHSQAPNNKKRKVESQIVVETVLEDEEEEFVSPPADEAALHDAPEVASTDHQQQFIFNVQQHLAAHGPVSDESQQIDALTAMHSHGAPHPPQEEEETNDAAAVVTKPWPLKEYAFFALAFAAMLMMTSWLGIGASSAVEHKTPTGIALAEMAQKLQKSNTDTKARTANVPVRISVETNSPSKTVREDPPHKAFDETTVQATKKESPVDDFEVNEVNDVDDDEPEEEKVLLTDNAEATPVISEASDFNDREFEQLLESVSSSSVAAEARADDTSDVTPKRVSKEDLIAATVAKVKGFCQKAFYFAMIVVGTVFVAFVVSSDGSAKSPVEVKTNAADSRSRFVVKSEVNDYNTTMMSSSTHSFLVKARDLTNHQQLCIFLRECQSHFSRRGRRSKLAPTNVFDTSNYSSLTKDELQCIARGFRLTAMHSDKVQLVGLIVEKYRSVLERFTVPQIKEVLKIKARSYASRSKKDDLIKIAVEAAF